MIAFQGEPGAYSEAALQARFGDAGRLPCASFDQVFAAVAEGRAEAGVVPIENSLAGSILENYDLLLAHDLTIVGEIRLPVRHCLLGKPGMRLADVKRAYSHPQALAQSLPYLKAHGIEPVAANDTAGAARALAERDEPGAAAIASLRAGALYGLDILAEGIQTRQDNTTRFFVIQLDRPADLAREKASLVFAAPNSPGALYDCLGRFARRGLNLTKIESRPTRDTPWEYYFYVDFEGDLEPTALQALLDELRPSMAFVRLLGVYPAKDPLTR
ncbi:MAG: putative prephenate dehydratase [Cyanobacteria bacterium RYN_339]|nr:putative prephenate dehydratase [Cyanobacteria bacterium RYN_339]